MSSRASLIVTFIPRALSFSLPPLPNLLASSRALPRRPRAMSSVGDSKAPERIAFQVRISVCISNDSILTSKGQEKFVYTHVNEHTLFDALRSRAKRFQNSRHSHQINRSALNLSVRASCSFSAWDRGLRKTGQDDKLHGRT